jgi:glucose-6-phosphate 1-dehydrogenase
MIGDNTLFARIDEVLASWKLLTPILDTWQATCPVHFPNYSAGTNGPIEADKMIAREGRQWRPL